jgi:hypothetical protein
MSSQHSDIQSNPHDDLTRSDYRDNDGIFIALQDHRADDAGCISVRMESADFVVLGKYMRGVDFQRACNPRATTFACKQCNARSTVC